MKLSEAIRLGEFALPPIRGKWFKIDDKGKPCGGCAVGRLLFATGYQPTRTWESWEKMVEHCNDLWPWTQRDYMLAPKGTGCHRLIHQFSGRVHILNCISDLYEYDKWTLPQIADWIATIEPQDQPVVEEVVDALQTTQAR